MVCTGVLENNIYSKKVAFGEKKITVWQKTSFEKFKWYTLVCTIYFGFIFANQKGLFYFQLKIVGGTAYNLKILDISDTFFTIYMIQNCGIAFIGWIVGELLVRSKRNSKVLKDSYQIMSPRFTNVNSLAAIARVFI